MTSRNSAPNLVLESPSPLLIVAVALTGIYKRSGEILVPRGLFTKLKDW